MKEFSKKYLQITTGIIILVMISCANHPKIDKRHLAGNYQSITKGDLKSRLLYKGRGVGTKLSLKADSTFYEHTCAINAWGKWCIKQDSLILNFEDVSWCITELNIDREHIEEKQKILKEKHYTSSKKIVFFIF